MLRSPWGIVGSTEGEPMTSILKLTSATSQRRGSTLLGAAGRGVVAGLVGVAAMTTGEKVEQALTRRPNSFVPARTLLTLLGRRPGERDQPLVANHAMHWGTGAALGALRGVWAVVGIRGTQANLTHTVVRLAFDQTLENTTGVGAPPATWPTDERVVDVAHKAVYSFVTGLVADAWLPARLESRRGTHSH
jgi:hypothetical protein